MSKFLSVAPQTQAPSAGTVFKESSELKKAENKKKVFPVETPGDYVLTTKITSHLYYPSRGIVGLFSLRDKEGHVIVERNFQLHANKIRKNEEKVGFTIPKDKAPASLRLDMTSQSGDITVSIELQKSNALLSHVANANPDELKMSGDSKPDLIEFDKKTELTKEERKSAIDLFKEYDTEKTGELPFSRAGNLLRKIYPDVTAAALNRMLTQIDLNQNDSIDLDEFLTAVAYYKWDIAKLGPEKTESESFEWEIPYSELKIASKLGEGTFGLVHRAKWRGITVAMKELKSAGLSNQSVLEEFKKEVRILARLRHPNIVLFIGACSKNPPYCMITEFLGGGSIFDIIHKNRIPLDLPSRLRMCWQTALGLNYLHLSDPQILHRDLKSMNLLVDTNGTVKICDFGLSCVQKRGSSTHESVGTPLWMAPEVLQGKEYNTKADIYSFAVCCYEIMIGFIPFSDIVTSDPSSVHMMASLVISGSRANIPPHVPQEVASLISSCWHPEPAKRPEFSEIADTLETILEKYQSPFPFGGGYQGGLRASSQ